MALHDENPPVVVATSVALAALLVTGFSALPWAHDVGDAVWPLACLAVAGGNVVAVRLLAAGARPGRLFLFPSIAGHLCWAVAAVSLALPELSWGASPFEGHAIAAALRWSAIAFAAVGALCHRRASTAPSPTASLRCWDASATSPRDRWGAADRRSRDGYSARPPRLGGMVGTQPGVRRP